MKWPLIPVLLLAIVSIIGVAGMLVAGSAWDWGFFVLAALPLLIGGALILVHRIRQGFRDICEQSWRDV